MIKNLIEKNSSLFSLFFSVVISLWLIYNNDIISRDSILYLQVAQNFLNDGLAAAFNTFKWPFYGIFIALVHKITNLSLEGSAYFLSIILEAMICVVFMKIYSRIIQNDSHLWVGLLFILSLPFFNEYRGDIIRGYGFWAFTLLAVYQFILYFQTNKTFYSISWQISILLAALFRPEAFVLAFAGPFYFLFTARHDLREQFKKFIQLNTIFVFLGIVFVLLIVIFSSIREIIINNLPPQADFMSYTMVTANFNQAVDNFIQYVLPFDYSERYSVLILGCGLLSMLLFKIINDLGFIYSAIWLRGISKKWLTLKPESYIVLYFSLIAFIILVVFVSSRLFVSSRYIVMLVLFLGLIFAQYLDFLLTSLYKNNTRKLFYLLIFFIVISFLDSVISLSAKKIPVKYASEYTTQVVMAGEKVACNEPRFSFYTNYSCDIILDLNKNLSEKSYRNMLKEKYQYLLLWVKYKDEKALKLINDEPDFKRIKEYSNRKNDKAILLKVVKDKPN